MNDILKKLAWLIIFAPAVYLAFAWKDMGETIALHFNLKGEPDRFGDKDELLTATLLIVGLNIFTYLLVTNIYRVDPKKFASENKMRLHRIAFAITLFLSALQCLVIYNGAHRNINLNTGILFAGIGVLFAILGNYMPNLKPNYFAGFRLPWTLENEDNWRKTHALAGKLWFAGGMILAIACLFFPGRIGIIVFFTLTALITIIPCIYSYRLYQKYKTVK